MLFRLCLQGLAPHPDHLRRQLDSRQIAGWIAYHRLAHSEETGEATNEPQPMRPEEILDQVRLYKGMASGNRR